MTVVGEDGFVLEGHSSISKISRDPEDLVAQTIGPTHQYPDGFALFLGTMFAPIKDRDVKGEGFTHKRGDIVTIGTPKLGKLTNRMLPSDECEHWQFGLGAMMKNLPPESVSVYAPFLRAIQVQCPPSDAIIQRCMSSEARNASAGALQLRCGALALRDRHQQVAAVRQRDADRGALRAVGHLEIIVSRAAGHVGDADHPARLQRHEAFADQIEIGDAIDLVVIGDAGVAIAETDLGPHIDLDRAAAGRGIAAEGAACRPARRADRARRSPANAHRRRARSCAPTL